MYPTNRSENLYHYNIFTMKRRWINTRIRSEFRSIIKVLIHFSISIIELLSILSILGLYIMLTITETCAYYITIGYWSMPFLLLAPISLWIVIWRRSSIACFVSIVVHFLSTLFATSIIIVSFLTLIHGIECSTSSLNIYYIPLNSIFIGLACLFKIFNYLALILLCRLQRNTDQIPTVFIKSLYNRNSSSELRSAPTNTYNSFSTISSETLSDLDHLFF